MRLRRTASICLLKFSVALAALGMDKDADVSVAHRDDDGFLVHRVKSPYQAGETDIRVLLPDRLEEGKRYPVIYVLPVEAGRGIRFGDGLLEVQKQDLHNKYEAIFVGPTFFDLPWYADHPTKPNIHQETHFLQIVIPFVEKTYPASEERLLLGFSKSGWGAWTLLLRHPQLFTRAAAWDAPLMMEEIGKYGTGDILGTQENFEAYCVGDLLKQKADMLRGEKRLILTGYGNFRQHHQQTHDFLDKLRIAHEYRDGPVRKHDWHSGWVPEAVELLIENRADKAEKPP